MKPLHLYSAIALIITGCSAEKSLMTPGSQTQAPAIIEPSTKLSYHLDTQGLPESGRWKSTPIIADINQDGALDLADHPRLEHGARVWLGHPNAAWEDASQGLTMNTSCGGGLDMGDINNDGKLDLAIADHCGGVFVYLDRKDNTWQTTTEGLVSGLAQKREKEMPDLNTLNGAEELAVGDVNEDGFVDIIYSGSDEGGFTVFLGDGSGKKWRETKDDGLPSAQDPGTEEYLAGWSNDVQLIDMNNDKHLDVVAAYYTGPHIWLGDGKGHWQSKSQGLTVTSMGGVYRRLSIADINGDGLKDLAIANGLNGAEAYLQKADGSWQGPTDMLPAIKEGATAIALGDLDGDGKMDAVIGARLNDQKPNANGLHIVLGDGQGHWQHEQGVKLPTEGLEEIWGISLADLNGDKRLDIVATTGSTSTTTFKTRIPRAKKDTAELPHLQVWLSEAVKPKAP